MQELIISIIIPILTALISYLGAIYQSRKELQQLRESHNYEINKIRETSKNEIEKINIEMDKQAELYEKKAQTDIVGDLMTNLLKGDTKQIENLEKVLKIVDTEQFNKFNNSTKQK